MSVVLKKNSIELIHLICLISFSLFIFIKFQDYILIENQKIRIIPIFISLSPILFTYTLFRVFSSSTASMLITAIILVTLTKINNVKQNLTQEPLSWSDITATSNFSVIYHYVNFKYLIALIFLIIVFYLMIRFKQFHKPNKQKSFLVFLILFFNFPFSFHIYLNKINQNFSDFINSKIQSPYIVWNWPENIQKSGLPLHLIQTSRREILPNPDEKDIQLFKSLQNIEILAKGNKPQNIIFILCESCWNDPNNFYQEFNELRQLNFHEFRSISPTYGGGTVNSSFELLTGLPARGALTGVIYQEYASLFRDNTSSYPSSLKKNQYQTIAAHNHLEAFWKRNIIATKLGFNEFIGLEKMNFHGEGWADDKFLYETAINLLKNNTQPSFYFLTTVHTHGGYTSIDGDTGEKDYKNRLNKSIVEMSVFIKKALAIEPNTAILIVGDHKPALATYFFNKKIFPNNFFTSIGTEDSDFKFTKNVPQEIIGDVPGFFYYPNQKLSLNFINEVNHQPLFCLSNIFDRNFTNVNLPSFNHARKNKICTSSSLGNYEQTVKKFPSYLYSLSLF